MTEASSGRSQLGPATVAAMREAAPAGPSVLVVEDHDVIGGLLADGLQAHGYEATWARSVRGATGALAESSYAVVLVDLGLPDGDGLDVVRAVRINSPETLVLIVTAREAEIDIIVGLDAGADDYLTKPVNLTVLLARLRAHLRRSAGAGPEDIGAVTVDDLTVDAGSRRCRLADHEISLRPKEFDLLWLLARNIGQVVSRRDLMSEVWDEHWSGSTKTLDVTMVGLRRQLRAAGELAGATVPHITTMRGKGYRLDPRASLVLAG